MLSWGHSQGRTAPPSHFSGESHRCKWKRSTYQQKGAGCLEVAAG